jgi:hypothetical protein
MKTTTKPLSETKKAKVIRALKKQITATGYYCTGVVSLLKTLLPAEQTILNAIPDIGDRQIAVIIEENRENLIFCTKGEELSLSLFGVKSLAKEAILTLAHERHWGRLESCTALVEFCGEDTHTLIQLAKRLPSDFKAKKENAKQFQWLKKELGEGVALGLLCDRDFSDIAKGVDYIREHKERLELVRKNIFPALKSFPAACHGRMVHDYIENMMKREEQANKPRTPVKPTLPEPVNSLPEQIGEYKILVPKHEGDLRRIGKAQGHCVGTTGMGYANKIKRGQSRIIAIYQEKLQDGVCVEVDADSLEVIQAQGKFRRSPTREENAVIAAVLPKLAEYQHPAA